MHAIKFHPSSEKLDHVNFCVANDFDHSPQSIFIAGRMKAYSDDTNAVMDSQENKSLTKIDLELAT